MKIIGILPLTFVADELKGKNASHNLLYIVMDKNAPYFDAVLAQEKYEWWLCTRWSIVFCIVGASSFYWSQDPVLPYLLSFFSYILPRLAFSMFAPLNRYMEFRGHAVEIEYAVNNLGADLDDMIGQEVRSLTGYKSFKGWSYELIKAEMRVLLRERGNVKL